MGVITVILETFVPGIGKMRSTRQIEERPGFSELTLQEIFGVSAVIMDEEV